MPLLVAAQRRAALESGAAFWSAYDAMGGAGAMEAWVQSNLGYRDRVHLTKDGYQRLGTMFYEDLTAAYRQSQQRARRTNQ
jgi:lysophospholipase L1-like esterase